jgi:hypothetical protein
VVKDVVFHTDALGVDEHDEIYAKKSLRAPFYRALAVTAPRLLPPIAIYSGTMLCAKRKTLARSHWRLMRRRRGKLSL